jgi:aromatic ring hydroxylase
LAKDHQSHQSTEQEMQWMTDVLDAQHKKANLEGINQSPNHLTNSEQQSLLKRLRNHEDLFNRRSWHFHRQTA